IAPDLEWLQQPAAHIIGLNDPTYPALLKEIPDPPALLFVYGDPAVLNLPQLAMVGSRNPSPMGAETARDFAGHLAGWGLGITSGLAQGIDAASHAGALDAGGVTIAVTGTGLDRVYPAQHRDLAHRIAEQGALVSEFPAGTPPLTPNFPRRNRIISGLCMGTLVVEAAVQSGSLITARQALEQGREVFAVPGSIHNPQSRGCHSLIRQGAKLVEMAQDIFEELGGFMPVTGADAAAAEPGSDFALDEEYHKVLASVGHEPASVDSVVLRSGLTAEAVCSMLLVLELQGYLKSMTGGYYCRTGKRT
ncbi:MAG: DNA-processing protein DprA, partial [Gammaproteobacteria bacterium]